jgi:hypothetical protein
LHVFVKLHAFVEKGADPKAILDSLLDQIESSKQELHKGVLKYSAEAMLLSLSCLKEERGSALVQVDAVGSAVTTADLAGCDGKSPIDWNRLYYDHFYK